MEQKKKRMRRATLRGWWKNIPFLMLPMSVFMSFAYLETARLQNQYEQSEVTQYIQLLTKEIEYLRANDRDLTRIEVMEGKSSGMELREPDPNQVVALSPISVETAYAKLAAYRNNHPMVNLPVRTVMLHVAYEDRPARVNEGPSFLEKLLAGGEAYGQEESD